MGEQFKDGDKLFTDTPKKVDKMASIKQIYSGFNSFFALSDGRGLLGWGDNSGGQISSGAVRGMLTVPQTLRISTGHSESINVVAGNRTTFLLSSQRAEMAENEEKERPDLKCSAFCGTEESTYSLR